MPSVSSTEASARAPDLRLCAVSVDLDEIPCYSAIHGLRDLPASSAQAVYRRALPRLVQLFERLDVPVTFFAVGRDLTAEHAQSALRELVARGHEIGNHSQDHLYDLTRRPLAEMREQVAAGARAIENATGRRPQGFRAPGYTLTDTLCGVLNDLGVLYDSSVFPCPAYYGAKVAAIGSYRLRRRPTHSIVDHPRVLTAPAEPYRIGRPYTRPGDTLIELPIGVTRAASGHLPFIGTSLIMAGQRGARWLCERIAGRSLVNLELHGIDAADAKLDGLDALRGAQPDLRKSADEKLATLAAVLESLREHGYRFVTLEEAAHAFAWA